MRVPLSPAQKEAVDLMAQGLTRREAASRLDIAETALMHRLRKAADKGYVGPGIPSRPVGSRSPVPEPDPVEALRQELERVDAELEHTRRQGERLELKRNGLAAAIHAYEDYLEHYSAPNGAAPSEEETS